MNTQVFMKELTYGAIMDFHSCRKVLKIVGYCSYACFNLLDSLVPNNEIKNIHSNNEYVHSWLPVPHNTTTATVGVIRVTSYKLLLGEVTCYSYISLSQKSN